MPRCEQVRDVARPYRALAGPLLLGATALAATVFVGCSDDGDGRSATSAPVDAPAATGSTLPGGLGRPLDRNILGGPCATVPAPGDPLPWLPADLPLPPGTYAVGETEAPPGVRAPEYDRGVLVVPVDIGEFARFALREWPTRGWLLGRGESEPGEVEAGFYRGDAIGAYRARSVYCDRAVSELLVVYGRRPGR